MSGSAFVTTLMVAAGGFEVTRGEPVLGGLKGRGVRHHHCDSCKSWVFTRTEPDQGFVNVRTTELDDPSDFAPFIEVYTSEQLPWVRIGAPRSYLTFPDVADYPELLAAYAAFAAAGTPPPA